MQATTKIDTLDQQLKFLQEMVKRNLPGFDQ